LSGGTLQFVNSEGIRCGYGGLGSFLQTGGVLNDSAGRYFSLGGYNGTGSTGNGVATFTGGTATITASYRILIPDNEGTATFNVGTETGGNALVESLSTTGVTMDGNANGGNGTLNLNSGTLQTYGPIYRANNVGTAVVNLNGGTLQAGESGITLISSSPALTSVNLYNGGVTFDTQAYTSVTVPAILKATTGNGIYPAGGIESIATGGGAGYIGPPLVAVSGGSGSGAMAIANVSGGVLTGVTLTCPGQNYLVGDNLSFAFAGGGPTTPASTFNYTLQASDLKPNGSGAVTKISSGTLTLSGASTYTGGTVVAAGTLSATASGSLGTGNVQVSGSGTLTLSGAYLNSAANLVLNSSSIVNLNFSGNDTINGLSLNGGLSYVAPGTYGSSSSSAANQESQFTGAGVLTVTTTPVVPLAQVSLGSSINPSVEGQPVVFTATVTGNSATATGTVTFSNGTVALGTQTLNGSAMASITNTFFAVGSFSITAGYSGNSTYPAAGMLTPLTQVVSAATNIWSGAHSAVWDINITSNWLDLGSPATYANGNYVQFDDTATGSTAITLGVTVTPGSMTATNNIKSYSIGGAGVISGATGLTLNGTGSLVLSNANSFTGSTLLNSGTLTFAGTAGSSGDGVLNVGNAAGLAATVNMNSTGSLTYSGFTELGGLAGDSGDLGSGAINQTAGTINLGTSGGTYLELGAGGPGAYGSINLSGGALNTLDSTGIRVGALGLGSLVQSGGTLNDERYFAVGSETFNQGTGGTGVATFTGGTAVISSSYRIILGDKPTGVAVMNLGTLAGGSGTINALLNSGGNGGLEFLDNAAAASGTFNLNSGLLQLAAGVWQNGGASGVSALNLNGGTIQANNNNINLINTSVPNVVVFNGGVVMDTQANSAITLPVSLLAATGNGIYPAGGLFTITNGGGSNYIGPPLVTIGGGSGSGALAIATVSNGVVTNVILTCPGQDYLVGDSLSMTFSGGGTTNPASTFNYTLQSGDVKTNLSGGLTKIGSGALSLTAPNFYTGITIVSAGTLSAMVDGSLGMSNVEVAGGAMLTLSGGNTNGYMDDDANLIINATSTVNLNYSGDMTVNGLSTNGGLFYVVPGTYGAVGSAATNQLSQLTGSGTITVTSIPVAPLALVSLTSSINPSGTGQAVIFTATVTGNNFIPVGTVTFSNGSVAMGTSALNGSAVATWTNTFGVTGTYPITATYNGDRIYPPASTLSPLEQVVTLPVDIWSGAQNNIWDINVSTNWISFGSPASYIDGNTVQFDDTAIGSTAISLGITVNPNSVTFTNNVKSYSISGAGSISGPTGLTLVGTGSVNLSTANAYTGNTVVSNGVLTFSGAGSSTGGGVLDVGDGAGLGILNMNSSGTLTFNGYASLGGISGDTGDSGSGAIYQTAGTINFSEFTSGQYVELGTGGPNAYGYYSLSGGVLNTVDVSGFRVGCEGLGAFVQSGGLLNLSRYLAIGTFSGSTGTGGTGVATFTGGSGSITGYRVILGDKPFGVATMNMGTQAGGSNIFNPGSIELLADDNASSAVLNLNSGTLQISGDIYKNTGNGASSDAVNMNGGTLQATAPLANLILSVDNVLVFNGGVVIDTQTYGVTNPVNMQGSSGNGIYPVGGLFTITNGGGSGYIGAPLVAVNGGSGSGATAIATISNGVVTNVIMTCPGQNYQAGDSLGFAFEGGGSTNPAGTFNYTLQAGDVAPNATGGLTKIGSGALIQGGFDSYTGNTIVSLGTLEVDGSLSASAVTVTGGTLDGAGSISDAVVVQSGGTLGAGSALSANTGTLYIYNNLSLAGAVVLRLNNNGGGLAYDNVQGLTNVNYGGVLTVTNITTDGTLLAQGNTLTLFSSSAYASNFSAFNLPALPFGLAWSTASLSVNGSIQVVPVNTSPTNLIYSVSGGYLHLSWPANYTGWLLEVETNLSQNNWTTVAGSAETNEISIPINRSAPSEFYRMVYP
jgi:autotransporter-associated beta strand protein